MSGKKIGGMITFVLAFVLLAACAGAAPTQPAEPDVETPVEPGGAFAPVDEATCEEVRAAVVGALDVEDTAAVVSEAPFADMITGEGGTGCQVTVTGTGEDFESFISAAGDIKTTLQSMGWSEDTAYVADSPTGTAFAMRQGDLTALVSSGWDPAESANCPEDQPISNCDLQPGQQLYTITVNIAQSPG